MGNKVTVPNVLFTDLVLIEKFDGVVSNYLNRTSSAHAPDCLHSDKGIEGGTLLQSERARLYEGAEVEMLPENICSPAFYGAQKGFQARVQS